MSKIKNEKISANGFDIQVYTEDFKNDYISLTDIARYKNTDVQDLSFKIGWEIEIHLNL